MRRKAKACRERQKRSKRYGPHLTPQNSKNSLIPRTPYFYTAKTQFLFSIPRQSTHRERKGSGKRFVLPKRSVLRYECAFYCWVQSLLTTALTISKSVASIGCCYCFCLSSLLFLLLFSLFAVFRCHEDSSYSCLGC